MEQTADFHVQTIHSRRLPGNLPRGNQRPMLKLVISEIHMAPYAPDRITSRHWDNMKI
jgi:hypothetical protein